MHRLLQRPICPDDRGRGVVSVRVKCNASHSGRRRHSKGRESLLDVVLSEFGASLTM
jgi:hypothetical protein